MGLSWLSAAVAGRQQQGRPAGGAENQQPRLQHPLRIRLFPFLPEPCPSRLHRARSILFRAPRGISPCPLGRPLIFVRGVNAVNDPGTIILPASPAITVTHQLVNNQENWRDPPVYQGYDEADDFRRPQGDPR